MGASSAPVADGVKPMREELVSNLSYQL